MEILYYIVSGLFILQFVAAVFVGAIDLKKA